LKGRDGLKNIKLKEFLRFLKYTLISSSAGLVEIGSFALLNEFVFKDKYWPSYLIALTLSVVWNFFLNRKLTFRSVNNVPVALLKILGYYAVFTPLSTILGNYLSDTLLWNSYLVTILNMLLNFATEFPFQRFVVFGKSVDSAQKV
jgi:putative flippase GtrA